MFWGDYIIYIIAFIIIYSIPIISRKIKILKDDIPIYDYITLRSFSTETARFMYVGFIRKKFTNFSGRLEMPKHLMYVCMYAWKHVY